MPGPLPNPQSRRRNPPTIPTTELPAEGRKGRAPTSPYKLGKAGKAWWTWAWKLPQATRWDGGTLYAVARRAQLEDELAAQRKVEGTLDLTAVLNADVEEVEERLTWLVRALKAHASGSTTVMREMRELDNRLGLNPKALADLRWSIADPEAEKPAAPSRSTARRRSGSTARLRAV